MVASLRAKSHTFSPKPTASAVPESPLAATTAAPVRSLRAQSAAATLHPPAHSAVGAPPSTSPFLRQIAPLNLLNLLDAPTLLHQEHLPQQQQQQQQVLQGGPGQVYPGAPDGTPLQLLLYPAGPALDHPPGAPLEQLPLPLVPPHAMHVAQLLPRAPPLPLQQQQQQQPYIAPFPGNAPSPGAAAPPGIAPSPDAAVVRLAAATGPGLQPLQQRTVSAPAAASGAMLGPECCFCTDATATAIMAPCGHQCLCERCHQLLKGAGKLDVCPVCRQQVQSVVARIWN